MLGMQISKTFQYFNGDPTKNRSFIWKYEETASRTHPTLLITIEWELGFFSSCTTAQGLLLYRETTVRLRYITFLSLMKWVMARMSVVERSYMYSRINAGFQLLRAALLEDPKKASFFWVHRWSVKEWTPSADSSDWHCRHPPTAAGWLL